MEVLFFGLGCHRFWQAVDVDLVGRFCLQAGMGSDGVVELQVSADRSSGCVNRLVGVEVDLFILDRLPDPLDEYCGFRPSVVRRRATPPTTPAPTTEDSSEIRHDPDCPGRTGPLQ